MLDQSIGVVNQRVPADWATRGFIAAWLIALIAGWCVMERFAVAVNPPPGRPLADRWPAQSVIAHDSHRRTLVLFLHPKCPCSRATLWELGHVYDELGLDLGHAPALIVVATVPAAADDNWLETSTIKESLMLPNSRLFVDRDGIEAEKFGATTSGLVMLFNEAGARVFGGGVTVARAHEGPNQGRDALTQILQKRLTSAPEIPAFGCRLCLPEKASPTPLAQAG